LHALIRTNLGLPGHIPLKRGGLPCSICQNGCIVGPESPMSYCGLKTHTRGHSSSSQSLQDGKVSYFFEPLPSVDGICHFCDNKSCQSVGAEPSKLQSTIKKRLTLNYYGCNMHCLFCNAWKYARASKTDQSGSAAGSRSDESDLEKPHRINPIPISPNEVASLVDADTACILFTGGDPAPQVNHATQVGKILQKKGYNNNIHLCFETNGTSQQFFFVEMLNLARTSRGTLKIDIKAFNNNLHQALTGVANERILKNVSRVTDAVQACLPHPVVVISTTIIPGYIDEEEIRLIASFIASVHPEIPYILKEFVPEFVLYDLPRTPYQLGEKCAEIARAEGLKHVHYEAMNFLGKSIPPQPETPLTPVEIA
jgi:pyruvate formate lyase activating enzyme